MNRQITLLFFPLIVIMLFCSCKDKKSIMKFENDAATWSINPNEYHHYMSIVAISSMDSDTNDVLAAFSGNTLHGYTHGEIHQGQVIHLLLVHSNRTDINIGFRLYQSKRDRVIGSSDSLEFKSGTGLGTPDNPIEIKF